MPLPDFIIIGAQKSATTFLHHDLMRHPEIFMPYWELPYFMNPDYLMMTKADFLNYFPQGKKRIKGFKSPDYLSRPECAVRIAKDLPKIKLIAILRNPIDRAVSAYYHYVAAGLAPLVDINKGLQDILNGKNVGEYPRSPEIVDYGFYFQHLQRYFPYFEKKNFYILLQEDIQNNYSITLRGILNFLSVSENYDSKIGSARPGSVVYSPQRLKFHRWMNKMIAYYDYEKNGVLFRKDMRLLRMSIVYLANRIDRILLNKIYGNQKPDINIELKQQLMNRYKQDIRQLQDYLQRDLSKWLICQ